MPAGVGGFIEGDVAVIADAAVAGVDAAYFTDAFADPVGMEGVRDYQVFGRRAEVFVDGGQQAGAEAGFEAEGVSQGEGAALPV